MNITIALLVAFSLAPGYGYKCDCPKCAQARAALMKAAVAPIAPAQFKQRPLAGKESDHPSPASQPSGTATAFPDVPLTPLGKRIALLAVTRNPKLSAEMSEGIAKAILFHSDKGRVDPALVAAIIDRESSFNPDACSRTGAVGLGQLTPATCQDWNVTDARDPVENVRGTAMQLGRLYQRWTGRENQDQLTVASYILGFTAVKNDEGLLDTQKVSAFARDVLTCRDRLSRAE